MENEIAQTVSQNLRLWRTRRGLTQAQIAGRLGVSQSHFSRLELGKKTPSLRTLGRLAQALEVTVSELTATSE